MLLDDLTCTIVQEISSMLFVVQVYDADLILLAMGFLGPEKEIIGELELDQDPRSNIKTPAGKYATSISKVFAAGGDIQKLLLVFSFR
jgi:NADPH-dependent glutamate synthase beta subunit-like oxidoreductase